MGKEPPGWKSSSPGIAGCSPGDSLSSHVRGPQRRGRGWVGVDIWGSTTGDQTEMEKGSRAYSDRSPLLGEHTPLCSGARAEGDQPAVLRIYRAEPVADPTRK